LLAESLGPRVVFSNFARSGALTADVAYEQLNAAMMFRPTVAVVLVGINDRLHPGERGHRLLAVGAFDVLAARDVPMWRRPALESTNPAPTRSQQAVWLATHGTRWLLARSADLLPELAWLVVTEWWGDRRIRLGAARAGAREEFVEARRSGNWRHAEAVINSTLAD
jgi:hypothetical protein